MSADTAVKQAAANSDYDAEEIRDPVVEVGAAIEAGLDKFDGTTKGTSAYEDGQEADAARARQRKGECGESDTVQQLVNTPGRGQRLVQGPEHCDS